MGSRAVSTGQGLLKMKIPQRLLHLSLFPNGFFFYFIISRQLGNIHSLPTQPLYIRPFFKSPHVSLIISYIQRVLLYRKYTGPALDFFWMDPRAATVDIKRSFFVTQENGWWWKHNGDMILFKYLIGRWRLYSMIRPTTTTTTTKIYSNVFLYLFTLILPFFFFNASSYSLRIWSTSPENNQMIG